MKKELQDLIRESRQELRRAAGIPLTAEERAEEQRVIEITRMEKFLLEALGYRVMVALLPTVIWTEKGATAQFTVDDHRFQLFKDRDTYRLSDTGDDGEHELLNLTGKDPNFARRVIVAVGDALIQPE